MKQWFVIQTRPAGEARATTSLRLYGLEAYMPQETVWRKTARARYERQVPLIRGYVFARLGENDMHKLHGMDGVMSIVRGVGEYRRLVAFIEWLQRKEGIGLFDRTLAEKRRHSFEQGQPVTVNRGPFTKLQATFLRMDPLGRAVVMFTMLGKEHQDDVPLDDLEAA